MEHHAWASEASEEKWQAKKEESKLFIGFASTSWQPMTPEISPHTSTPSGTTPPSNVSVVEEAVAWSASTPSVMVAPSVVASSNDIAVPVAPSRSAVLVESCPTEVNDAPICPDSSIESPALAKPVDVAPHNTSVWFPHSALVFADDPSPLRDNPTFHAVAEEIRLAFVQNTDDYNNTQLGDRTLANLDLSQAVVLKRFARNVEMDARTAAKLLDLLAFDAPRAAAWTNLLYARFKAPEHSEKLTHKALFDYLLQCERDSTFGHVHDVLDQLQENPACLSLPSLPLEPALPQEFTFHTEPLPLGVDEDTASLTASETSSISEPPAPSHVYTNQPGSVS